MSYNNIETFITLGKELEEIQQSGLKLLGLLPSYHEYDSDPFADDHYQPSINEILEEAIEVLYKQQNIKKE